jgi:hypothetical protein
VSSGTADMLHSNQQGATTMIRPRIRALLLGADAAVSDFTGAIHGRYRGTSSSASPRPRAGR